MQSEKGTRPITQDCLQQFHDIISNPQVQNLSILTTLLVLLQNYGVLFLKNYNFFTCLTVTQVCFNKTRQIKCLSEVSKVVCMPFGSAKCCLHAFRKCKRQIACLSEVLKVVCMPFGSVNGSLHAICFIRIPFMLFQGNGTCFRQVVRI